MRTFWSFETVSPNRYRLVLSDEEARALGARLRKYQSPGRNRSDDVPEHRVPGEVAPGSTHRSIRQDQMLCHDSGL